MSCPRTVIGHLIGIPADYRGNDTATVMPEDFAHACRQAPVEPGYGMSGISSTARFPLTTAGMTLLDSRQQHAGMTFTGNDPQPARYFSTTSHTASITSAAS